MQLMPATAESLGVEDPYDARQNITGGAKMLGYLLADYNGDVTLALAAYNAGSGAVRKYGGVPTYSETENYIRKITPEQIERLVKLLKGMVFPISDYAPFEYAVVTAGGVSCEDVNRYTMESLKVKGLYFAGEVLDLDANTGGYNLQIAFSTGRLAGMLKQ